jgi:hypothetical protein
MSTIRDAYRAHARLSLGVGLAVCSTVLLLCLEAHFRPLAKEGLYFQEWSSEFMMQTVSIEDLRDEPFRTLWNIHIQPPAYDALRALLASCHRSDDSMAMLRAVDRSLYVAWALVYGMTAFLIFWWLSSVTRTGFAAAAALLFCVHPATIYYATFLDTTLLSAFLVLWLCYLLWKAKEGHLVSGVLLAISFLSLFFTRSIFQWPWLFLLALSLLLMRFPLRKLAVFLAITGGAVALFTLKQVVLFHLSSTSSFTGLNLCHSLSVPGTLEAYRPQTAPVQEVRSDKARVLWRVRKANGSLNFNHEHYLAVNQELIQKYREQVRASSPRFLAEAWLANFKVFLRPSSQYMPGHVIAEHLPYRSAYDFVFSGWSLLLLLTLSFVAWLVQTQRSSLPGALGLFLPVAFTGLLCILCERPEAMRYKFFIEPVLFVFLASQLYGVAHWVLGRASDSRPSRTTRAPHAPTPPHS